MSYSCRCGAYSSASLAALLDHAATCPTVGPSLALYRRSRTQQRRDEPLTIVPDRRPTRRKTTISHEEWSNAYAAALATGATGAGQLDSIVSRQLGIGSRLARELRQAYATY